MGTRQGCQFLDRVSGQIVTEGVFRDSEQRSVVAVVGGTGEFRNARGQMFILRGPTTKLVLALLL